MPVRAANLAAELDDPPAWLGDFAAYLAPRRAPTPACRLLTAVGRVLADGDSRHPQAVLARCDPPDGPLARALEDFFTGQGLALPTDRERRAARRRQRRIDAAPEPLRPAVAGFAGSLVSSRERATRAGTRPRDHATIDLRLNAVRDFACFLLAERSKSDWATIEVGDVEAFLGQRPSLRAQRLTGLRQFFRYTTRARLVLVDPTRGLTAPQPWGFHGPTLPVSAQRELFRRWTSDPSVHPHEAFVGLFALLHAATTTEIRNLRFDAVDVAARTVAITGRTQPTPLDPWTWTALQRCLDYRRQLRSLNPHVVITRQSKTTRAPASGTYIKDTLDPVGIRPRILRSTRLVSMVGAVDPKLVAAAYGMTNDAVTIYLADSVDQVRLEPLR